MCFFLYRRVAPSVSKFVLNHQVEQNFDNNGIIQCLPWRTCSCAGIFPGIHTGACTGTIALSSLIFFFYQYYAKFHSFVTDQQTN